ncbi:hypothetical protein ZHAS_00021119 [Anopheles sinensis]|uniref:Uncharacterized protein n=1 Tax=Anopheles sinensis TaxID=74873 RepID=A0A084WRK3_ANOSI|nr:hypothetical protein ZHAS_00021119 [Anopheles sinensis]
MDFDRFTLPSVGFFIDRRSFALIQRAGKRPTRRGPLPHRAGCLKGLAGSGRALAERRKVMNRSRYQSVAQTLRR